MERLREGSVSVKFAAQLGPQETGDLLLEISSGGIHGLRQEAIHSCPAEGGESITPDRRMVSRMELAIPALVEAFDGASAAPYEALTENISANGACIRFEGQPDLLGRHLLLHLSPSHAIAIPPMTQPAPLPECTVMGEVAWTTPATLTAAEPRKTSATITLRAGIRFLPSNDEVHRRIAELLGRFLISPVPLGERAEEAECAAG